MINKQKITHIIYKWQYSMLTVVVKQGLIMLIPLILTGSIANALLHLPIQSYQTLLEKDGFSWLASLFSGIYQGTFGIFSLGLVITLSLSFAMERNESVVNTGMYLIVSLCTYGVQLNIGSEHFNIENVGVAGCFSALIVTLVTCYLYEWLRRKLDHILHDYVIGIDTICASAIQTLIPAAIIIGIIAVANQLMIHYLGVYSLHELFSNNICDMFNRLQMKKRFLPGLIYTVLLHSMWFVGLHGSHILEPVALTNFKLTINGEIFSKPFFDTFVVMGGCGTTICMLLILLFKYGKKKQGRLAKIASFTVMFNTNDMLVFGMPVVFNPTLVIPFILTPTVLFCVSYMATVIGILPPVIRDIPWTTPVFFSGYLATGSIIGTIWQGICIGIGVLIYTPFLRMHERMEQDNAFYQMKELVKEFQIKEQANEQSRFLVSTDQIGQITKMLLQDLKCSIENEDIYLLFQPQVDNDGHCLGAEALLRWQHPTYGFIYPPLIIYLAKEGQILQQLEEKIFDMAAGAIKKVSEECSIQFKISVNITAKSLLWDIEGCIDQCVEKYQIQADRLWLEITEQDVLLETDQVISKLYRMKNQGHRLLIDDFGMGHTSLLYLQSNYFDMVKLDGSLVKNILDNPTNQKIVSSIINLSKQLNVGVVAEYVETVEEQKLLESYGCRYYQGYLYSKPVPLKELIAFMNKK